MSRVHDAIRRTEQFAFAELIRRLFHGPSVVAIIGIDPGRGATDLCEGLAKELSRMGRSVVLVNVHALLQPSSILIPDKTAFIPGSSRNVCHWPSLVGDQTEYFSSQPHEAPENWLESLRLNFDSVLLDCPALEEEPGGAAIAAMAEAGVLAVDAERTPKHQILHDQHALQLSGVKLAGCILINAK